MTMRVLLDGFDDRACLLHEQVASGKLIRIDVNQVRLKPGETVSFKITVKSKASPEDKELEPFGFVGDDPPPKAGTNLSLQLRADPGDRFSVEATAELSGSAAFEKAQFIAVYETDQWINYLPAVFREDLKHADFLSRFLDGLFVDGEKIEDQLDRIGNLIVPSRLPTLAAARYLAGWFDIDLDLVLPKPKKDQNDREKDEHEAASLEVARKFLTRVMPHALGCGTADSVLTWVDAVAEARRMSPERRRRIALVEGFKVRRLFTLHALHDPKDPEPTELRDHWGWLPSSGTLAPEPLAQRAFLDSSLFSKGPTLGLPGETRDPTLLARLLGSRLWLFVPKHICDEPDQTTWRRLLEPILPAQLRLEIVDDELPFTLGYDTVLGLSTGLTSSRSSVS